MNESTSSAKELTRSSMPSFFSCSTTEPRLDRKISGYVCSCRSLPNEVSVYSRKHLPGCVRPARPALWCALACTQGRSPQQSLMAGILQASVPEATLPRCCEDLAGIVTENICHHQASWLVKVPV